MGSIRRNGVVLIMRGNVKAHASLKAAFGLLCVIPWLLLNTSWAQQPSPIPAQILVIIAHDATREAATLRALNRRYADVSYRADRRARKTAKSIATDYSLKFEGGWQIRSLSVYCALMRVDGAGDVEALATRVASDERIESAQPVYEYHAAGGAQLDDPYVDLQGHYALIDQMDQDLDGKGVSIGVIDTGIDQDHPEFTGQINRVHNFLDGQDEGVDNYAHGTAVTGIIAAARNNGTGIAGIAPQADFVVYQACWHTSSGGSPAKCNSFTIANALTAAIDAKHDVLNLSLAGPSDPIVARLTEAALDQGATIVAADPMRDGFRYPASLPGVVKIRSANNETEPHDALAIYLPDSDVISTAPGGGYDVFNGTSMAAAVVSGVVALLRQSHTNHRTEELVNAFRQLDAEIDGADLCERNGVHGRC